MKIVRHAKCSWKAGIELFDKDLCERMQIIIRHETQRDMVKAELLYYRRALGFATKGASPWWRSDVREWQIRNEDRFKETLKNWHVKNQEKWSTHRKIYLKNYYSLNKEREKERVRQWGLNNPEKVRAKNEIYNEQRRKRYRDKANASRTISL